MNPPNLRGMYAKLARIEKQRRGEPPPPFDWDAICMDVPDEQLTEEGRRFRASLRMAGEDRSGGADEIEARIAGVGAPEGTAGDLASGGLTAQVGTPTPKEK